MTRKETLFMSASSEWSRAREESTYYRRKLHFQQNLERDRERARKEQSLRRVLSEGKGYADTHNRLGNHTGDNGTAEKTERVRRAKRTWFPVPVPRWKDA